MALKTIRFFFVSFHDTTLSYLWNQIQTLNFVFKALSLIVIGFEAKIVETTIMIHEYQCLDFVEHVKGNNK